MRKGKAGRGYSLTEKGRKYLKVLQEFIKELEEIEKMKLKEVKRSREGDLVFPPCFFGVERMVELKAEKIEMIRLADGALDVEKDSLGRITIEVKSAEHYLRATLYRGNEVLRLFYFLKPTVIEYLKLLRLGYQDAIDRNREKIKSAENSQRRTVWDFIIPNNGKRQLSLEEAKQSLAKQEQELKQIEKELELIQMVGKE